MILYGKNPVLERIRVNPGTVKELFLQKGKDLSEIVRAAAAENIYFKSVDSVFISDLCKSANTQGVAAKVPDFEYQDREHIFKRCLSRETVPVFLDNVTDPHNIGAVIRTLSCLGGFSIILPMHRSGRINPTVLRVASGGENHIDIGVVKNTATAIKSLKKKGSVLVIGADAEGQEGLSGAELSGPTALVLGSEGKGIRPGVKKVIDVLYRIPMPGADLSYNVSVAGALFAYEIMVRRKMKYGQKEDT
jgi:23S rRNA (guanosine2251-2'-O)-methyltransferase